MKHIVLLGDSIFDNAAYVGGGPDVPGHLRALVRGRFQVTLLAVDGSVTTDVRQQLTGLPPSATHLVVSAGGNDALGCAGVLDQPVRNVVEAVLHLARIKQQFAANYREMLRHLLRTGLPLVLCTIYDPCYPEALRQEVASTALNVFNDSILRLAALEGLPVIDLRLVCSEAADYANPIEPGVEGGRKIAGAILEIVTEHDFNRHRTTLFH